MQVVLATLIIIYITTNCSLKIFSNEFSNKDYKKIKNIIEASRKITILSGNQKNYGTSG